jgi:hypothetical protein
MSEEIGPQKGVYMINRMIRLGKQRDLHSSDQGKTEEKQLIRDIPHNVEY